MGERYFTKKRIQGYTVLAVIIAFFLVTSYYSSHIVSKDFIQGNSYSWMVAYLALVTVEIILGFVSAIPLIPLATEIWGISTTFFLTYLGWIIGSAVIYLITRKLGIDIIKKIVPERKLKKYEKAIPEGDLFTQIIITRLFIPYDILSYVIVLFTNVKFWPYIAATAIGFLPWTLVLVLIGNLSFQIQLAFAAIWIILVILKFFVYKKKAKS